METHNIIFFEGTDLLKVIGLDRAAVHSLINKEYTERKKADFAENTTDFYDCYHIFYDADDICEAIELCDLGISVFIDGIEVMGKLRCIAKNTMQKLDCNSVDDGYSIISKALSIGITCPFETVEGILVGRKAYYE
jgi:hypothetical protein